MNEFLPGFEPDAAERAQLRFVGGVLDLRQFDKILISVTARVCMSQSKKDFTTAYEAISAWCRKYIGKELKITADKDWKMIELWDDRCVSVIPNTGIMVQDALVREVQSMKNDDVKRRARIAELEAERDRLLEAMYRIECKINSAKTACPPFVQHEFGGGAKMGA